MLALKIDRDYYIPYLPSSEFNLRSDVPTIADMKIITATTMPITTEARPQESTMIRRYTWEIFPANQVVARSWRGKCKLCIKMTDKFDIKIICIFVFFILQFLFQISKFRPNRKATLKRVTCDHARSSEQCYFQNYSPYDDVTDILGFHQSCDQH